MTRKTMRMRRGRAIWCRTLAVRAAPIAPGDTMQCHEFHYWDAEDPGSAFRAVKPSGRESRCGYVSDTLYAGYPHLYFPSCRTAAERFIKKCVERRRCHEANGN